MAKSKFYTSVDRIGNRILLREIVDGIENRKEIAYEPVLYVDAGNKEPTHTSLYGKPAKEVKFNNISSAKDFFDRYKEMSGFEIYGRSDWVSQYLYTYSLQSPDFTKVKVTSIDIETRVPDSGFPKPSEAIAEVTLITCIKNGEATTFGCKEYSGDEPTNFVLCDDEEELLKEFIKYWSEDYTNIVTGWNINGFDLLYLYNRITDVLGSHWVNRLSPWGKVTVKEGKYSPDESTVDILGIQILDYIDLMKKYTYGGRVSWKLGAVAQEELGTTKLDHSEWKSLNDFQDNDWNNYVKYNIIDSKLVKMLNDKMQLIELAMTIAFEAKINYQEVYSPVRTWQAILHNRLLDKGIVVPQRKHTGQSGSIAGGFVKDTKAGMYKWVCSLDATSLYPSIMMMLNLSPETFMKKIDFTPDDYLRGTIPENDGYAVAANGVMFSKEKLGIIPETIKHFFDERRVAKNEMLRLEQEYEDTKNEKLKSVIAAMNNKQMAFKILQNSLFGSLAQEGFMFFNNDVAEAITLTGQLFLRYINQEFSKEIANVFGIKEKDYLIAIDTDSLYICCDEIVNKFLSKETNEDKIVKILEKLITEKVRPIVNKFCHKIEQDLNVYDSKISFKLEKVASKAIFVAKKKYAAKVHSSEGVTFEKPKIMVTGLEMVRSSTPPWVAKKLETTLEDIFEKDEAHIQSLVKQVKSEFMKLDPSDVARPTGVKGIDIRTGGNTLYPKGTPIHVRAAILYNDLIVKMNLQSQYPLIREGDKMKYIYLKEPNTLKENVIGWPVDERLYDEFKLNRFIDWDTQFDKTYLAAVNILLNAIGWSAEKIDTLDEFF